MMCSARTCIVPIQDYLGLGSDCRMNVPGTVGINWRWRLTPGAVTDALADELFTLAGRYGRLNWETIGTRTIVR